MNFADFKLDIIYHDLSKQHYWKLLISLKHDIIEHNDINGRNLQPNDEVSDVRTHTTYQNLVRFLDTPPVGVRDPRKASSDHSESCP